MNPIIILLQGSAASFASMLIGFIWYSESLFARIWWRHTFPGVRFGDTSSFKSNQNIPLYTTLVSVIIQSAILTFTINTVLPLFSAHSPDCAGIKFPAILSLISAGIIACASFPHYIYSRKSFTLYLICSGHDAFQITAGIFAVYLLHSPGSR